MSAAVEAQSSNHWTTREFPKPPVRLTDQQESGFLTTCLLSFDATPLDLWQRTCRTVNTKYLKAAGETENHVTGKDNYTAIGPHYNP